jgi:histidyl-tRNA synthetase
VGYIIDPFIVRGLDYYTELTKLGIKDSHIDILNVLYGKNISQFRSFTASSPAAQDALDKLETVTTKLDAAGVGYIIDPFIVRGLDYYTGTVFETFIDGKIELGSICSG